MTSTDNYYGPVLAPYQIFTRAFRNLTSIQHSSTHIVTSFMVVCEELKMLVPSPERFNIQPERTMMIAFTKQKLQHMTDRLRF